MIENAVTGDDVSGLGAGTANIASVAEIESGSGTENVIAREKEIVIGTENVITANHIRENVHAAGKESANVKEIVNIESEAEKKGKPNYFTRLLLTSSVLFSAYSLYKRSNFIERRSSLVILNVREKERNKPSTYIVILTKYYVFRN